MNTSALKKSTFKLLIRSRQSLIHSYTDVHRKFGFKIQGRLQVMGTYFQVFYGLCNCSVVLVHFRKILEC